MDNPSSAEIKRGYLAFQQHEKRDAMYKTATFLVSHFWGRPYEMANSIGVLLLTWNNAFYRYGLFDYDKLEECISNNLNLLDKYRKRDILDYSSTDDEAVKCLFQQFLVALQMCEGKKKNAKRPVGVAKALHLLAPAFFPIWDDKIAHAYGCYYADNPVDRYVLFLRKIKEVIGQLQPAARADSQKLGKTLVKLVDEYNYAKHTKHWDLEA